MATLFLELLLRGNCLLQRLFSFLLIDSEAFALVADLLPLFREPCVFFLQRRVLTLVLCHLCQAALGSRGLSVDIEDQHGASLVLRLQLPDQVSHCLDLNMAQVALLRHLSFRNL
jgi:hypothetical protein